MAKIQHTTHTRTAMDLQRHVVCTCVTSWEPIQATNQFLALPLDHRYCTGWQRPAGTRYPPPFSTRAETGPLDIHRVLAFSVSTS